MQRYGGNENSYPTLEGLRSPIVMSHNTITALEDMRSLRVMNNSEHCNSPRSDCYSLTYVNNPLTILGERTIKSMSICVSETKISIDS
jgi:hypothetical protein